MAMILDAGRLGPIWAGKNAGLLTRANSLGRGQAGFAEFEAGI